jgi:acetyl esterase/lipase
MGRLRSAALLGAALLVLFAGCGGSSSSTSSNHPLGPQPRAVWGGPSGGAKPKALIILVHGGGWKGIDPTAFNTTLDIAKLIQRLGFETLTVDYRGGAEGIADVDSFYRQARRRVGPHLPICAYGASAGGHISLMLAVQNPDLNCVIDLAGPSDLPALAHDHGGRSAYQIALQAFGRSPLAALSPALHAGSIKAKLLLVYAANDPLVPVAQGREMARADPRAQLIVLPPGSAGFVHTGVGAPISATGVDPAALAKAQQVEIALMAAGGRS